MCGIRSRLENDQEINLYEFVFDASPFLSSRLLIPSADPFPSQDYLASIDSSSQAGSTMK